MAFPTVPTTAANTLLSSTTTTASTTHTFPSLTTLAPAAGDLLIAICVQYSGTSGGSPNDQFSSWGAGFTETRDDETTTANDLALGVAHKIATGSESGTFDVTSAFAARSVNFLMRIPAATWHGTTIPEVLAAVRAAGAVADPGSFDPANWAAEDTLWISVYGHSETTTTGSPPTIDTPPANYTGQLIVARNADAVGHITAAVAFRQANATSQDVGAWTVSNPTRGNGLAAVVAVRPHEPQTKTITEATETDAAQAAAFVQGTNSIGGVATETDLANSIVPLQTLPAASTNTALELDYELAAGGTHVNIQPALETDSAQAVTYAQASDYDIVHAAETDAAVALDRYKLAPAAETDTAQPVSFTKTIYKTVGEAAETDTAQALSIAQASDYDITLAAETDTAGLLAVHKLAAATETDTTTALTYSQAGAYTLTLAAEADAAQALTAAKQASVDAATETDLANQIVALQPLPALETDTAQALSYEISGAQHINITTAAETDAAQAVTAAKLVTLPEYEATPPIPYGTVTIGDTATAMPLTVSGPTSVDITAALETDSPQTLTVAKHVTLVHAAETDTAGTLGLTGQYDLTPATETDTAGTLRAPKLALAAETDSAETLTYSQAGAYSITPATETDTAQAVTYAQASDYDIQPATETDLVFARVAYKLTLAAETDAAQTLSGSTAGNVTPATETSTAVALTFSKRLNVTAATETSTAVAVTASKAVTLVLATETDAVPGLPYGGAYDILPASETNTATTLLYGALPRNGRITFTPTGRIARARTGRITKPKEGAIS